MHAPNARRRRPPRPDPPPPPGCVGRGALASTPDHAGSTPVRGRSHASAGPRAKKGRLWSPRKKPPPPIGRRGGWSVRRRTTCMAQRSRNPRNRRLSRPRASTALARFFRSTHPGSGYPRRLRLEPSVTVRRSAPIGSRTKDIDEPATSTARRVAAATWMIRVTVASRAYRWCPRGGREGARASRPRRSGSRFIADASRRDRAARSPDPQPASGRFGVAFVLARLRALDTAGSSAGPAASFGLRWSRCPCRSLRTNSWPRRCSPFEFALAHLPGFAGREEGFGPPASAAALRGTSNVRPWNPVVTAIAGIPSTAPYQNAARMSRRERACDRRCSAP